MLEVITTINYRGHSGVIKNYGDRYILSCAQYSDVNVTSNKIEDLVSMFQKVVDVKIQRHKHLDKFPKEVRNDPGWIEVIAELNKKYPEFKEGKWELKPVVYKWSDLFSVCMVDKNNSTMRFVCLDTLVPNGKWKSWK